MFGYCTNNHLHIYIENAKGDIFNSHVYLKTVIIPVHGFGFRMNGKSCLQTSYKIRTNYLRYVHLHTHFRHKDLNEPNTFLVDHSKLKKWYEMDQDGENICCK